MSKSGYACQVLRLNYCSPFQWSSPTVESPAIGQPWLEDKEMYLVSGHVVAIVTYTMSGAVGIVYKAVHFAIQCIPAVLHQLSNLNLSSSTLQLPTTLMC